MVPPGYAAATLARAPLVADTPVRPDDDCVLLTASSGGAIVGVRRFTKMTREQAIKIATSATRHDSTHSARVFCDSLYVDGETVRMREWWDIEWSEVDPGRATLTIEAEPVYTVLDGDKR